MKLLALDTATEACSAAFLEFRSPPRAAADPRVGTGLPATQPLSQALPTPAPLLHGPGAPAGRASIATAPPPQILMISRELEPGRGHSEHILRMVQEVLSEAGVSLRQLDAIAFGRGPGAFTGVRLAASITQGMAFGAGLPVVPVSDLQAVAQRMLNEIPTAGAVVICNDARMQEVYWTCCGRDSSGLAAALLPERVGSPHTVHLPPAPQLHLPAGAQPGVYGAGRGFRAYPQLAARLRPQLLGLDEEALPRAREIAQLAQAQLAAGRALPPEQALPVYLRDDVARPQSQN